MTFVILSAAFVLMLGGLCVDNTYLVYIGAGTTFLGFFSSNSPIACREQGEMSALSHTRTCSQNLFPTPQRKNLIRQLPRSRRPDHHFQKTVLLPVLQRTYATSTEKLRPLEICF